MLGGIESVPACLRCHRITIGGEDDVFHDDLGTPALGSIEGRHEHVEVDGQRVHGHGLVRQCTDESSGGIAERLVVVLPRPGPRELALDTHLRPAFQLDGDGVAGGPRLQAQGVAGEVGDLGEGVAGEGWDVKVVSPARVGGVQGRVVGTHGQILVLADHNSGKACRRRLRSSHARPADPPDPTLAPMARRTAIRWR